MQGRVVVITGATSGIGQVAAERLAALGARVLFIARDHTRGRSMLERLRRAGPGAAHEVRYADLSSIGETTRVAREIRGAVDRIDVLINNAGAVFGSRRLSADGLEMTFALNHMAYFVLTAELEPRLRTSTPARIVNTASAAHVGVTLNFDDLQYANGYRGYRAYRRSKLCNILYTRELARRLAGTGVTANCLHPGFVATRFGDEAGGAIQRALKILKLRAISPEQGADTIVYLASSPEVAKQSGLYFYKCRVVEPSPAAQDDRAATRLWDESARLAARPTHEAAR